MTSSYNDIRNSKTILIMRGNPAEAHPVSLQHILEGKELNHANMIVIDPRMTRTAAHATEYVRVRPGTHIATIYGMLWHIFENGWEDEEFLSQRVYGVDEVRKQVAKWTPAEVERVTGLPEAQVRHVAETFAKREPATLIWAMVQTQFTTGTANVRASCILLLATGNVGLAGGGANIFRGHINVQGATDLGLDVTSLPLYYGLTQDAWQHWCRVWDMDYGWMVSRFSSKALMEGPGIPSTRWFDATLLPKAQVTQPDNVQAMFMMGHGVNTITRMQEAKRGIEKLELLVVCDPYPTACSVLSERKDGIYLLPACTSFEMDGSRRGILVARLSGGIQRVAIEHGCSPYGNAKARMIAWNLPDPVPVHREPIYTPRPDLVADYPTLPDARQFVGLGQGQILLYASQYLTGSLYGRPLVELRETFQLLGIERVNPSEPEDHIATLCETMTGLVGGAITGPDGCDRDFFAMHLATWARRFFADLERASPDGFYASVGSLGRAFMEIETKGYSFPA